jgi:hypothetical protein
MGFCKGYFYSEAKLALVCPKAFLQKRRLFAGDIFFSADGEGLWIASFFFKTLSRKNGMSVK